MREGGPISYQSRPSASFPQDGADPKPHTMIPKPGQQRESVCDARAGAAAIGCDHELSTLTAEPRTFENKTKSETINPGPQTRNQINNGKVSATRGLVARLAAALRLATLPGMGNLQVLLRKCFSCTSMIKSCSTFHYQRRFKCHGNLGIRGRECVKSLRASYTGLYPQRAIVCDVRAG